MPRNVVPVDTGNDSEDRVVTLLSLFPRCVRQLTVE